MTVIASLQLHCEPRQERSNNLVMAFDLGKIMFNDRLIGLFMRSRVGFPALPQF